MRARLPEHAGLNDRERRLATVARYKARLKDRVLVTHEELLVWLSYDPGAGIFRWRKDGEKQGGGRQKV
jgi:hypothetical protein